MSSVGDEFGRLSIGYVPYSPSLSGPGDRRRFVRYAKLRDLRFEIVRPGVTYDLVVLSHLADLTKWRRMPRGSTRLIFDLPDSYFDIPALGAKALLRGTAKFVLRQHAHLEPLYRRSLAAMCERADGVLCSTPEQKSHILPYNRNTHAILDFHSAETPVRKTSWALGDTVHLGWEGLGENLFTLGVAAKALEKLAAQRSLQLHLVTDLAFKRHNGPVPKVTARSVLQKLLPANVKTFLYEYNSTMVPRILTGCDLGIIPIDTSLPIYRAKAENKLLLMWRLGLPALTTDTPAYSRTMRDAGVNGICASSAEWFEKLSSHLRDEKLRQDNAEKGRAYGEREHGEARLLEKWDALLHSVLG